MTYYIGEAVKLWEKMSAHVLEVAFVMSFVLLFIMAVRFMMRKSSKFLFYGLCGAAVIMITAGCGMVDTDADFAKWFSPWVAGNMEEEEAERLFRDIGTVVGESQTVDGVTVTLEGIVQDQNILLLAFTVDGAEAKTEGKENAVYDADSDKSWILPDHLTESLRREIPDITDDEIDEYLKYYSSFAEGNPSWGSIRCSQYDDDSYLIMCSFENGSAAFPSGMIHLEDLDSFLFSLKGPYDFTYRALKTANPVVYTGDVPFTTPSGVRCRVNKVVLNPLCGAKVQLTADRELEEFKTNSDGEKMMPDWKTELYINAFRTDAGYEVGGHMREQEHDGADVTLSMSSSYWILDAETAEAVLIGENWVELSEMTRSYEGGESAA